MAVNFYPANSHSLAGEALTQDKCIFLVAKLHREGQARTVGVFWSNFDIRH